MATPYERIWRSQLATSGMRNCFKLPWFSHGFLYRVVIKQVGGTLVGYNVRVFNSERPCTGTSESSGGDDPAGYYEASPEMYNVFGATYTGHAGDTVFINEPTGRPYVNGDETPAGFRQHFIHVEITPDNPGAGDADSAWDINIAGSWEDP